MSTGKILLLFILSFVAHSAVADEVTENAFTRAQISFNKNLAADAQTQFLHLLEFPEYKNQALYYLTLIELQNEHGKKAREYLEQAKETLPDTAEELVLEGDIICMEAQQASIFKALGLAKKCIAAYEKAATQYPDNPYALTSAILFYLHAPSVAGGSIAKAEEKLAALEKVDSERAIILNATRLMAKKEEARALALLDELSEKGLKTIHGAYTSARIYRDNKHHDKAIQALTTLRTLALSPTARFDDHWMYRDSYLQHGELLLIENHPVEQAIALLETYNEQALNPKDMHYFWGVWSLAKAYKANDEPEKYQQQVARIKAMDYQKNKAFAKEFDAALKNSAK